MRTLLSNLRTLLGPFLEITRTTVRLKTEIITLIDCARFVTTLHAAEQVLADPTKRSAFVAAAVALYQGPLLDGFHIRDAEAFTEWLRAERQHFQQLALQALSELKTEYTTGQQALTALETRQSELRQTMLRISGAIQVLEEVLSEPPSPPNGVVPHAEVLNGAGALLNVAN